MSDDIVTRLRYIYSQKDVGVSLNPETFIEAADEIERLREWKELAYQMRNKYWWVMWWKTRKKFEAMHKADWALPKNVKLREQLQKDFGK